MHVGARDKDLSPARQEARQAGHVHTPAAASGAGAGSTQLQTRSGVTLVQQSGLSYPTLRAPDGSNADLLQPVLEVASMLIHALPPTSASKIKGAVDRYRQALTFWALELPSELASLAYVVARCCPPVGVAVPAVCKTPVAPSTAAGDIDALARACELSLEGLTPSMSSAFHGPQIRALLRAIGARVRRLRTNKKALLYAQVQAAWERAEKDGSPTAVRDGFAIVMAFFFGLRISELIGLVPDDIAPVQMSDGSYAMRVTFRQCKNRRSVLMQHQPFIVSCGHPLLMRAWRVFEAKTEYYEGKRLFHRMNGSTRDPLSRAWFAGVIAAAAPGTTPHSARVGLATELWAAGKSIDVIMAAGRWTSPAAVLYVIGALEDQVAATRAIGAGLAYADGDLRRIGTSPEQFSGARPALAADVAAWGRIAGAIESYD